MSIEKKSLISTLKTTKKANVATSELDAKPTSVSSKKMSAFTKRSPNVSVRRGTKLSRKMSRKTLRKPSVA